MVAQSSIPGKHVPEPQIPEELTRNHVSFYTFVLRNRTNRNYLLIAAVGSIVQFVIFKLLYPFADFFSDSYSYIYGAQANLDINIWPIGYSWFLRYFHFITHSDTAVVAFQYFFLILAALVFFFSIQYFYKPSRNSSLIIYVFLFFNPLFLYISNYINSDPLFAGLSLLWITQLIWIVQRPMMYQVLSHALLLYLCFIVRNNAMIYPFISAFAFLLSNHRKFVKWFGIGLGSLLVLLFINHQRNAAYKLIGQKEFSLFTGWQLANNALYIRNKIPLAKLPFPTNQAKQIDSLAVDFYKRVNPEFRLFLSAYGANFFIREREAPLKRYFKLNFNPQNDRDILRDWGTSSIPFKEYGSFIIKEYPIQYFKHFMLLNSKHYFIPPLEKLDLYNLGQNEVWSKAKQWFNYKTTKVTSVSKTIQGKILFPFPILFLFINICFLSILIWYLITKQFNKASKRINKLFILSSIFLVANMAFSIFATINVMRYQFFPMIVGLNIVLLMSELMEAKSLPIKLGLQKSKETINLDLQSGRINN